MTDEQKIALVTGANKGIGKHIARQLAQAGLLVFVGSRDRARGRPHRGRRPEWRISQRHRHHILLVTAGSRTPGTTNTPAIQPIPTRN
jgi:NAD(P)-dependent dehydrogenase (short-subunit alcohol dehydrogenase family)